MKLHPVLIALAAISSATSLLAADPGTTRGIIDIGKADRPADAVILVGPEGHSLLPEGGGPTRWVFADGVLTASPAWDSVLTRESYRDFHLQGHHNPVRFRDVWIQTLSLDSQPSAKPAPR